MIGPVTNVAENLIGGATISFGYLCDYLKEQGEHYTLINTKRYFNALSVLLNPIYVFIKVLLNTNRADVIFLNSSRGGTKHLAPVLFWLARLIGARFVFRPFGGDINKYTATYGPIRKWIFKQTILKADIFFLQTKALVDYYKSKNANTEQLPTSRDEPAAELLRGNRPFQKRFAYLGFVNEAKGIDLILEASQKLGSEYTIHIYGPIKENLYEEKFKQFPNVYQGVLNKSEVLSTLAQYDVLLLPSHYEGEGYPGAIIEAYSLGMPVIATDWRSIPELVEHGKTGRLIKTKSPKALIDAIGFFDEFNYPKYSTQARACFEDSYSTQKVNSSAIEKIKALFLSTESAIEKI